MAIWPGEADLEVQKRSKRKTYNVKITISVGEPKQEKDEEGEGGAVSKDTFYN